MRSRAKNACIKRRGLLISRVWLVMSLALGAAAVRSQQASDVKEPEYVNQFALLGGDGKLAPLEQAPLNFEMKSKRNFVIAPKMTSEQVVQEPKSPVRAPADAHFVVRLHTGGQDPTTMITLRQFQVRKKDRELLKSKASAGILPWSGVKSQSMETSIPVSVKKYGKDSFEVVPAQKLPPGEYAFVGMRNASCFGVDAQ